MYDYREDDGYDAIVVGSGYGGSVSACRMSMAGIKVCLLEKGRRWEAEAFPTDSLGIISATRIENHNLGFSFGSKDALFQVRIQNDSLVAVACGLGGGSLVNAGVMLPTPVRARRNSKWPKEWEADWDICEATAASMLNIQSVPVKFPIAKLMGSITDEEIGEISESSVKLSVNFDIEDSNSNSMKLQHMGSCLACGNCLAGCPYNAKNSTDKNYIASAIKAGCVVKTETQVQCLTPNPKEICKEGTISRKGRRWRVYFNEIDFITSDFVILSAGVFGTTEILFQSQMRGLALSEMVGSGFSCNGNTVAYLAGSKAPLNAYGLDKKHLSKIPFHERPGPSISSCYTSSLGFTIQSAVLPTAYPYLLFKGITTFGWPNGYSFLHGIIDKMKHILGLKGSQAMVLNAMGYDNSNGKITFDKDTNMLCFTPPHDPFLPRKIEAFQKLTKRLGGILFMSRYRSSSVHLLGGCIAAKDKSHGVCDPKGQVFDPKAPGTVHPGLYVCDASLIPCSIGVNPSLTIATAAEHVSRHLVQDVLMYKSKEGRQFDENADYQNQDFITDDKLKRDQQSMVIIKETMRGYIAGMPCTAYLKMKMNSQIQKGSDKLNSVVDKSYSLLKGKVGGYVIFKAIEKDELHVIDGEVNLCEVDSRTPYTQYMHYRLLLTASSGSRYVLEGKKIMNPYLYAFHAWGEMTTLHVTFKKLNEDTSEEKTVNLTGKLKISISDILKSLISLRGTGWGRFICLLSQTFLRTYVLQIPRGIQKDFISDSYHKPYSISTLHEMRTGDGFIVSCRQWKCSQSQRRVKGGKQLNPVLLLNGHSTESYWLPTEPNDLIRTLLDEGYETWLLQPRLHPVNSSNNFTVEDIGRFDIPSAINKILELHGIHTRIHVVAHCVGGLAIHIALMGGHVSAACIASLTCTNSSMFFKLNALSRMKMWLPLVPISMVILGKNKVLPLLETSKASARHQLLKSIARYIPRYERCTCDECEVFSGLFGNTFWHVNISPTMHNWLNKKSSTKLPMAAFPHLRKICNHGFIVDSNGNNSYLIHPERMALSTVYISGGRSLLVTPQTSFLANKYMKLHHPGFRHKRVVVEGFGHSDLLIGEESNLKVFPHILDHISSAEEGSNVVKSFNEKTYKEDIEWGDDQYEEANVGIGKWLYLLVIIFLIYFGEHITFLVFISFLLSVILFIYFCYSRNL